MMSEIEVYVVVKMSLRRYLMGLRVLKVLLQREVEVLLVILQSYHLKGVVMVRWCSPPKS